MKTQKTQNREMTGRDFEALPESEKQKIIQEIESKTPEQRLAESRPLNKRERADFERRRKAGRPKFGKHGVKVIALSVERDLLARADTYAKEHGLKRAEFFTRAIIKLLPKAG
jgi:hypothetical protein